GLGGRGGRSVLRAERDRAKRVVTSSVRLDNEAKLIDSKGQTRSNSGENPSGANAAGDVAICPRRLWRPHWGMFILKQYRLRPVGLLPNRNWSVQRERKPDDDRTVG